MSDQPTRRTVPLWVFVVTFVGVAAVAGLVGWLLGAPRPVPVVPPVETSTTVTTTVTVTTTTTVPATSTVEPTTTPKPPTPPKPKTTKEWAFLTGGSISGGKLYIKADYIYFYPAGTAADNAKSKYGGSLRMDGSYVRNLSSAIKTLTLKANAEVLLIEWAETGTAGSTWKYGEADPYVFVSVLAGTASSPTGVWSPEDTVVQLTVTGSTVSKVSQYQQPQ